MKEITTIPSSEQRTSPLSESNTAAPSPLLPSSTSPGITSSELRRGEGSTFWGWLRQTARLWGFLAFILLIVIVFRRVILPFLLAGLVAYILSPVLRFLCHFQWGRFKLPRFVWLIVLYLTIIGLLSLFFTSFVPRVTNDFKVILKETPTFWQKVRAQWIPHIDAWMQNHFGDSLSPVLPTTKPSPPPAPPKLRINRLPDGELELDTRDLQLEIVHQTEGTWVLRSPTPIGEGNNEPEHRFADALDRYIGELRQSSTQRLNQVVRLGQLFVAGVLEAITMFILVLMISIFLLLDSERILRGIRALFPQRYTKDFDNMVEVVDKGLSGAVRGQLLICCINGILTWIGLYIFNVKYSFLLALLAAMMSLIPIFGSILSSVPIVIVALVSGQGGIDLLRGIMILGWIIGIHLLEANLLNPKIIGTATRIQPVVVIFAVVAGEQSYGPVGALLAVPLVSAVQGIFLYLRQKIRAESMSEK